jgi:hypothetical protein
VRCLFYLALTVAGLSAPSTTLPYLLQRPFFIAFIAYQGIPRWRRRLGRQFGVLFVDTATLNLTAKPLSGPFRVRGKSQWRKTSDRCWILISFALVNDLIRFAAVVKFVHGMNIGTDAAVGFTVRSLSRRE